MSVYLVPFPVDRVGAPEAVDMALADAGLPSLGEMDHRGEGFGEKLMYPMDGLDLMVEQLLPLFPPEVPPPARGATPCPFAASYADAWLPVPFSGLIAVDGVEGIYNDTMSFASAYEVHAQAQALATAIDLPADVPQLEPRRCALNDWRAEMAPSANPDDPLWRLDLDAAFYVALFLRVSEYAIANQELVGYR